jgi:hypothetical protein
MQVKKHKKSSLSSKNIKKDIKNPKNIEKSKKCWLELFSHDFQTLVGDWLKNPKNIVEKTQKNLLPKIKAWLKNPKSFDD